MQRSGDTQEKSLEAIQYVIYKNVRLLQTASFDKRWYLWLCFSFFALGHFLSYIQVKGAKSTASVLPNTL